ncbi:MAG: hypothetical protein IID37_01645 [Planctomycetes bacterium]|nr:hypothetical protein [Planctomycetota bacterium]
MKHVELRSCHVRMIGLGAFIIAASVCWTASNARADVAPRPDEAASLQVQEDQDEGSANASRRGNWSDDFESYANGSQMHGQGGWQGWDGSSGAGAFVTQVQNHTTGGLQSVDIRTASDLVYPFSGHDSGVWNLTVWQYVPGIMNAPNGQYFIVQKEYNDGGPYQWSIQMQVENDGTVHCDCGAADNGTPGVMWIADAWNLIEAEIDLDGDSVTLSYNGTVMGIYSWTAGVFGTDSGCPLGGCIGAIDLFAFSGTSVYYDDFELTLKVEDVPCEGDANGDGTVDPLDSGFVLARFGCEVGVGDPDCDAADQNGDGEVDPLDSGFVLARFGPCDY